MKLAAIFRLSILISLMLVVKCEEDGTLNIDDDDDEGDSADDEEEYVFDETEFGTDGGEFGDNGDELVDGSDDSDDDDESSVKCLGMPKEHFFYFIALPLIWLI